MKKGTITMIAVMQLTLGYVTQAQQQPADSIGDQNMLETVTVRENRLRSSALQQNRNIQILDQQKIAALPVHSVTELLAYVSGVDLRQRGAWGTQADVSIDGGTFDQTLVLVNGLRVTDPQTGHNMMNLPLTLDLIDHIEILRGSAARVYGINALTGAINIVTRTPDKTGAKLTGYGGSSFEKSETSSNLYNNWGVRLSGSLAGKSASHLLSASHDLSNGYRYNTGSRNEKLFYQGQFRTNSTDQLELMAGYANNRFAARGFYSPAADSTSFEITRNFLSAVSYQAQLSPQWIMRPRVSYSFRQDEYQIPQYSYRNLHKNHILSAEINNSIQTSAGDIGIGIEARQERIASTNLGDHQRNNYGLSAEYKTSFNKWLFTAGGYLNYNSDYGWQFFPGIDAGYRITPKLKLYANAGTAQRIPTFTDLYYSDRANLGNPGLEPEQSRYIETGLKFTTTRFHATASYFFRRVDHFIDYIKSADSSLYPSAGDTTKARAQNFRTVDVQGFSLNADYRSPRNETADLNNILLSLGYTYLKPRIRDPKTSIAYSSKYALSTLRHQLQATIGADFLRHWALSVSARYMERLAYTDYFLLDAHLHWEHTRFKLFVDATNLTDLYYTEEGVSPMPGRWLQAGLSLRL
ncbi:TonB-dependent receptor [Niabella terrae]